MLPSSTANPFWRVENPSAALFRIWEQSPDVVGTTGGESVEPLETFLEFGIGQGHVYRKLSDEQPHGTWHRLRRPEPNRSDCPHAWDDDSSKARLFLER